jgi:CO/xanthine dehydrogenase FAD-binding subunit
VTFLQPLTLAEALGARAAHPEAVVVAGGTDVLVDVNFERLRPDAVIDLTRVAGLRGWERVDGQVRVAAGTTYRDLIDELADDLPGLAAAARTVGSPPIRNRGTIGGNLGSASPAGDCHPPLLACGATLELSSVRGVRRVPVDEFFTGPKRSVLAPDELIAAVLVPAATGPQSFVKVGPRHAMVIAVCSFALAFNARDRRVGTGIGSAGPTPLRARAAEDYLLSMVDWDAGGPLPDSVVRHFGQLVADAARPIDDVRGTAAYRRHALGVIAGRALTDCWDRYREAPR